MITYQYVDPAATGLNIGVPSGVDPSDPTDPVNWNDAWNVLQSGVNAVEASGIVYCRGVETLSASLDFSTSNTVSGLADGRIIYIGVNAAGQEDGTKYVLDCNNASIDGVTTNSISYIAMRNFEIRNTNTGSYHGMNIGSSTQHWILNNVYIHNCGGNGIHTAAGLIASIIGCRFSNNDGDGVTRTGNGSAIIYSVADHNGGNGFKDFSQCSHTFCLAYNNGGYGFHGYNTHSNLVNCVSHGNNQGFYVDSKSVTLVGCRATGNISDGVFIVNNDLAILVDCYIGNNGTDINGDYVDFYRNGFSTNIIGGSDINCGYVDPSGVETGFDNFNLRPDATLRSIGVELS